MSNEVKKNIIKSGCNCGKDQVFLEFDFPLDIQYLPQFKAAGFNNSAAYATTGIIYIETNDIIAIGSVGQNRFEVKCKSSSCDGDISAFERTLQTLQVNGKGITP